MSTRVIRVIFLGSFRQATGSRTAEFPIEEKETVRDLLTKLIDRFGDGLRKVMWDEMGQLRQNLIIRLDGENINSKEGLATQVRGGQEVIVMPAVTGG